MKESVFNTQGTRLFFIFFIFLLARIPGMATVIYVDADAGTGGDGSSWVAAYTTVYEAIDAAAATDTIWVAAGTYYPEAHTTPRLAVFNIEKEITLIGGFSGFETSLSERDYKSNPVILSGDIGVAGDSTDNVYHVVKFGVSNELAASIDGFIIEGGYAVEGGGSEMIVGGGIHLHYVQNKTIINCTFQNNVAEDRGGAIFIEGGSNNVISNCVFRENQQIIGTGNTHGGGAAGSENTNGNVFDHCLFENNRAAGSGGAFFGDGGVNYFNNSIFRYNACGKDGGALFNNGQLSNCIIRENSAEGLGGGVYYNLWKNRITNCVFFRNEAPVAGAVGYEGNAMVMVNTVLLENEAINYRGVYSMDTNDEHEISYSRMEADQTGTLGDGNFIADPLLDTVTLYPLPNSPCIDAGNGDVAPSTDLTGNVRRDDIYKSNTGVGTPAYADIGAYEFQGNSSMNGAFTIGASGDFESFSEAVDSLVALGINGDVFFDVEAGTYNEQLTLPVIAGASDTSRIVFRSATGDSTTVVLTFGATTEQENYTLKLDGTDYISFENMTFRSTGSTYARILEIAGGTKHNSFLNNRFEGVEQQSELVYKDATTFSRDSFILFSNNHFLNGKYAMDWSSSYELSLSGNIFTQQSDHAILMELGYIPSVTGNLFYSERAMTAITLNQFMVYYTIEKNRIYLKNGGKGVITNGRGLADTDTSTLINNYIYLNTHHADAAVEISASSSYAIRLKSMHNTIHVTGDNSASACFVTNDFSYIYLTSRNNNFVNMAGGPVLSGYKGYGDYNNLYTNGSYITKSNDYTNLEIFQLETNRELNSLSVQPYFVSDTSWIPTHPALNNSGFNVGVTEDIEGNSRTIETPDIGAGEFTPPSPVPFHGSYVIGGATPDYESLNGAVDALVLNGIDGAVVFTIEADTLYEFVRIPEIDGASATNTITFTSAGSDTAVLQSNHRYTLYLDGADYMIINQLKILNEYTSSYYDPSNVILENGANNNQFTNNYFKRERLDNSAYLIRVNASLDTGNVIASNIFEDGRKGIYFSGNDAELESGNQIINNRFNNFSWHCIQLNRQKQFLISGNTISDGVNSSNGITVTGSGNGLISNNIINNRGSYQVIGIKTEACDSLKIYFNTLRNEKGSPLMVGGSNLDLKNNILVHTGFEPSIICSDSTGFESDYNVFYSNSALGKMNWLGSNIGTLEAWQDSSGNDTHSMFFEPEFVSIDDLHTVDLRLNGRATPLADVTIDIDGEARHSAHPDIGADETDLGFPMAGEYPVGPSRQLKSFNAAVDSLLQVGIIEPVLFLVDNGIYNEQLVIPEIPLSDEGKTVTFRSVDGDSTAVKITYTPVDGEPLYTVLLDGADRISFEGISFENNTMNARVIEFRGGAEDNIISGCHLYSPSTEHALVFSNGDKDSNNRFSNNYFSDGGYGIYFIGDESGFEEWNVIENNIFHNQHQSGIYMQYQQWTSITGNMITHAAPIEVFWTGIYLLDCNGQYNDDQSYQKSIVANNMIHYHATGQSAGIALKNVVAHSIFHNSVNIYGDSNESRSLNMEDACNSTLVFNNMLVNKAGGVIIYAAASGVRYDYNLLHSNSDRFIYTNQWVNSLVEWQSTGNGAHSIDMDPGFLSDSDLHTFNLELMGKGIAIGEISHWLELTGVTEDYDGDARDSRIAVVGADVIAAECGGPLNGGYRVGTGADYETMDDALIALAGCGISGTVTLSVEPGAYNWQISLPPAFPGYDPAEDSLIVRSSTGVAADVVISYDSQPEKNYLLKVNGLDNFVLQHITLEALSSNQGRLLEIAGGTHSGYYEGNVFKGIESDDSSDQLALVFSPAGTADSSIRLIDNHFLNGSYGIILEKPDTREDYLEISGNHFLNQSHGMLLFNDMVLAEIAGNSVQSDHATFSAIGAGSECDSLSIRKNVFRIGSASEFQVNSRAGSTLLSNNAFRLHTTGSNRAYVVYPRNDLYLYHNTMVVSGDNANSSIYYAASNSCDHFVQQNNVLANLAGGKLYSIAFDIPEVESDHNNLYSSGDVFGLWEGVTYDQFTDFVSVTGLDQHSFSADPQFRDDTTWYSRHVLHNNTGVAVEGMITDLDGNERDVLTPDLGAEEFEEGIFSLGTDRRVCSYDSYTMDAGIGFDSYLWSDDTNLRLVIADTAGYGPGEQEIWLEVSIGGVEYRDTVLLTFSAPVATPVSDYCFNSDQDTIHIIAGEGASWSWDRGDTTQTLVVNYEERSYFNVTVTDSYGCVDEGSIMVHYNNCLADMNLEDEITINKSDQLDLSAHQCNDDPMFDYIWSTGGDTYSIKLSGSDLGVGDHTVWVEVLNGFANYCGSSDTLVIHVEKDVGVLEPAVPGFRVYPNPSTGKMIIEGEGITNVEVYNMQGLMLIKTNEVHDFDLGHFPAGTYLLRVWADDRYSIKKIQLL
ncbi:MAG: right-handed parallel beta-helix repeat-containing protein [Bacteroidales bacterium]